GAGQYGARGNDVGARDDALRHGVTQCRSDISAAAAIADRGETGLQDLPCVARCLQRVELYALLELELPHVGLVAVIGEVRVRVKEARRDGQAAAVDDLGGAPAAQLCGGSRRANPALGDDDAGVGERLATRTVDQRAADE